MELMLLNSFSPFILLLQANPVGGALFVMLFLCVMLSRR